MNDARVTVRLSAARHADLRATADAWGTTPERVVVLALAALPEAKATPSAPAKPEKVRAATDSASVARELKAAVRAASGWEDLARRLRAVDLELVPRGGGLADHGCACSRLIRRFRSEYPGHAHGWLEARLLPGAKAR